MIDFRKTFTSLRQGAGRIVLAAAVALAALAGFYVFGRVDGNAERSQSVELERQMDIAQAKADEAQTKQAAQREEEWR